MSEKIVRKARLFLPAVLCLALPCSTALAATLYVDPTGTDIGSCPFASPCASIGYAVTAASDGDDVSVAPGSYTEADVHIGKALDVHGAGAGVTLVEAATGTTTVFWVEHDDVTLRDMTVENGAVGARITLPGSTVRNTRLLDAEVLDMSSHGVYVSGSTTAADLDVERCLFERVGTGIESDALSIQDGVTITDSVFRDNLNGWSQSPGLGYAQKVRINGSEFTEHSGTPVIGDTLSDFLLEDCLFEDNAGGFLVYNVYGYAGLDVENVVVRGNTFRRSSFSPVALLVPAVGVRDVQIEGNVIETDVGLLATESGQIEIGRSAFHSNGPLAVTGNTVVLSGAIGGGSVAAAHALRLTGDLNDLTIHGNTLDGGGVGGADAVPPTSGIFLETGASDLGTTVPDGGLDATCNVITGFVNGVSVYNTNGGHYGGLPSGAGVRFQYNDIAGNSGYGVRNGSGGGDEFVEAMQNWWGSSDGPSGDGPGSGDAVGGNVLYGPQLSAAINPESCPSRQVRVDVRPGSDHNQINTTARQLVPIAVLSDADFDACTDMETDCVDVRGASPVRDECADVDGDGRLDRVLYFRARNMDDPTPDECAAPETTLTLTGCTMTGQPVVGEDTVEWLGPSC